MTESGLVIQKGNKREEKKSKKYVQGHWTSGERDLKEKEDG